MVQLFHVSNQECTMLEEKIEFSTSFPADFNVHRLQHGAANEKTPSKYDKAW